MMELQSYLSLRVEKVCRWLLLMDILLKYRNIMQLRITSREHEINTCSNTDKFERVFLISRESVAMSEVVRYTAMAAGLWLICVIYWSAPSTNYISPSPQWGRNRVIWYHSCLLWLIEFISAVLMSFYRGFPPAFLAKLYRFQSSGLRLLAKESIFTSNKRSAGDLKLWLTVLNYEYNTSTSPVGS